MNNECKHLDWIVFLQQYCLRRSFCQIKMLCSSPNHWKKRALHCLFLFLFYSVTIDSIHEVCEGMRTEVFRRFANNNFDPNCCFSIYHGDHVESLDLVSTNGEEARTWITGLKYLLAGISDEDSLAKRQRTRDQYPFNCVHWGGRVTVRIHP